MRITSLRIRSKIICGLTLKINREIYNSVPVNNSTIGISNWKGKKESSGTAGICLPFINFVNKITFAIIQKKEITLIKRLSLFIKIE